jgi:hypothetical protein
VRETRDTFLDQFSEKTTEIYAANGGGDGGLLFAFLSFFLFKHRLLNVLFPKTPHLTKKALSLSVEHPKGFYYLCESCDVAC